MQGYKDSADKILECKYEIAKNLINDSKIVDAYNALSELGEYKDCKELLKSIKDTYDMIMAKPKLFVNADWEDKYRSRRWVQTKVIDDNTLNITIEGSNGAADHSTTRLAGKWDEATGKINFSGKSYRTVGEWDEDTYLEKTYCEDENVTGYMYYKNGCMHFKYDGEQYLYTFIR